jgi:hypothetical protein
MPSAPAHKRRRRPPFFHPVPLRPRCDGWSVERQCEFLARLYLIGSVGAAAKAVGMSRNSAYRLRARAGAEDFAFAWDAVLTPPGTGRLSRAKPNWRKVTNAELDRRMRTGLVQPVIYRGKMVHIRRKADNSALLRLVRRLDAIEKRSGAIL